MSALIAWARAFDRQITAVRRERERQESVYRRTLRQERNALHDEDAERLRKWLFNRWLIDSQARR